MRPFVAGIGAILTLHHVRPPRPGRFQPNQLLEVTPRFLENVVRWLRRSQLDLVSLDEMHRRLVEGDFKRRFACLTIDDGYRDTLQWAYPILKANKVPFCVYIPTSFPDRIGELWWLAIEAVVVPQRIVLLVDDRAQLGFTFSTKNTIFDVYNWGAAFAPRTSCAAWCGIACAAIRHQGLLRIVHELGRALARRRSAVISGAHRQPRHAGKDAGRRHRDGHEPP